MVSEDPGRRTLMSVDTATRDVPDALPEVDKRSSNNNGCVPVHSLNGGHDPACSMKVLSRVDFAWR